MSSRNMNRTCDELVSSQKRYQYTTKLIDIFIHNLRVYYVETKTHINFK